MDGVTLLERARGAGLSVTADRDRLIVRGPKTAGGVARGLLAHKAEVLAALRRERPVPGTQYGETCPDKGPKDPRPDLTDDSALWAGVLQMAHHHDGHDPNGVYGVLHGIRCCGARLVWQTSETLRIVPGDDYLTGSGSWEADRERWLVPHRKTIAEWLQTFAAALRADEGALDAIMKQYGTGVE